MIRTAWFERKFARIEDNGLLPGIIERLEGSAARLSEKMENHRAPTILEEATGKWSIKKEIGHLIDLEPLWLTRMQQIFDGKEDLVSADLSNEKTHKTPHDKRLIVDLIQEFRQHRAKLVTLLRQAKPVALENAAKHPRLGTPMRAIDLAFFIAEHDDHHLAQITFLQK